VFAKQTENVLGDEGTKSLNIIKLVFSFSKFGIVDRHRMVLLNF